MSIFHATVDVYTVIKAADMPKRNRAHFVVEAENINEAERLAYGAGSSIVFGPKIVKIEVSAISGPVKNPLRVSVFTGGRKP